MAVRLNKRHQDFVKKKIQASQLINRLQNHALGKVELMSRSQVIAAKILLDKTLSNAPSQITGDPNNPLNVRVNIGFGSEG